MTARLSENPQNKVLVLEKGKYYDCPQCDNTIQSPVRSNIFTDRDAHHFSKSQLLGTFYHDYRFNGAVSHAYRSI